ncbi:MAG: hypothetical protein U0894_02985 [Pirellulales bacterium]
MFALILIEFLLRLIFGIGLAMFITSSKEVTSGFFRVHLWVLMGLATFGAMVAYLPLSTSAEAGETARQHLQTLERWQFGLLVMVAVVSYVGAVVWLYEASLVGKICLLVVTLGSLAALLLRVPHLTQGMGAVGWASVLDRITSGTVLGTITTAMLLGHWYLNAANHADCSSAAASDCHSGGGAGRMLVSGSLCGFEIARRGRRDQLEGLFGFALDCRAD